MTYEKTRIKPAIMRRKQVEDYIGLSRATIYNQMKAGLFPNPVKLWASAVGWLVSDVDAWLAARIENSTLGGHDKTIGVPQHEQ
ncbi:hypothetical protein FACS1894185_7240 [Betaproteobacteria bacterium]|nr:hypothetical protein FACS1894185_7240 [Betaproteobacteria bacterium]